jgi:hypothetical protein
MYICPEQNGQPAWIMEFPLWWERGYFFREFGERQFDTGNLFYVDYELLLAGWEAMAWDDRCRERFAKDPCSKETFLTEAMQRLETLLETVSWVIAESYEWESGLS